VAGIDWSSGGEAPFSRIGMSATANEVSLTRHGAVAGTLRVNLRWTAAATSGSGGRAGRRGLLPRKPDAVATDPNRVVDLDLGCLYQFTDGQRGVIQAVGRRSGDYARAPFIRLDRDDRIGSSTGENIFVNMDQSAHFQRILIFVMVAGGSDDITKTAATVTIYPTAGPALEIRLEGPSGLSRARSCAVAQIRRQGPEIVVRRELRYFSGFQSEIDAAYGWGLHWGPGPGKAWL
jgi:tellurite resistance protein TerA